MKFKYLTFYFHLLSVGLCAQSNLGYNLHYSSFLGGTDFEQSRNLAIDKEGFIYLTGGTSSPDFPTTPGVYQEVYDGRGSSTVGGWGPMSVFVSKFSPDGQLVWSTFVGGPSYDRAYAIEVGDDGKVYIGGRAGEGYPTTSGAFQEQFTTGGGFNNLYGHQNGFISILSADGTELLYSTYYGSDSFGFFRDIDIDDKGYVYGVLNAVRRLPRGIRQDAFSTSHSGGQYDMAPVKFSPQLDSVVWATMLGGSGQDRGGPSIRVGTDYSVFVAGATESQDFPITPNAAQPNYGGGQNDMFITRINPEGTVLIYSTYFGGNDLDVSETHCLFVDNQNQAHVACGTKSTDIPTTQGAVKSAKQGSDFDALLGKLSSDGQTVLACSYFGGTGNDFSEGLHVGEDGDLYFGGTIGSDDMPTTLKAIQSSIAGQEDAFIVRLDSNFTRIKYSTYFGGSRHDAVRAFAVSEEGEIVFGGQTESNDLLTTQNAFQVNRVSSNNEDDCYFGILTPLTTTSVISQNEEYRLYPNPATDYIILELNNPVILDLEIFDIKGRMVYDNKGVENQTEVDISNFSPGMYLYKIKGQGSLRQGVFVKQ